MTRILTFLVLALAPLLASGCISNTGIYGSDVGGDEGTPRRDMLYTQTWTGTTYSSDGFEVPLDYDHLQTTWAHSGHALGTAVFTSPGGRAYDSAPASGSAGPVVIDRTLPSEVGTATVRLPPTFMGAGTYTVQGIDNIPAAILLSATWTERYDGAGPAETSVSFYVPPGVDQVRIVGSAAAHVHPGFKITDQSGQVKANPGPSGTGASVADVDASPGVWTLHLYGPYRGAFSITVTPR